LPTEVMAAWVLTVVRVTSKKRPHSLLAYCIVAIFGVLVW
jgi:hypothetical protein